MVVAVAVTAVWSLLTAVQANLMKWSIMTSTL